MTVTPADLEKFHPAIPLQDEFDACGVLMLRELVASNKITNS
jgi:hypothetical protein